MFRLAPSYFLYRYLKKGLSDTEFRFDETDVIAIVERSSTSSLKGFRSDGYSIIENRFARTFLYFGNRFVTIVRLLEFFNQIFWSNCQFYKILRKKNLLHQVLNILCVYFSAFLRDGVTHISYGSHMRFIALKTSYSVTQWKMSILPEKRHLQKVHHHYESIAAKARPIRSSKRTKIY